MEQIINCISQLKFGMTPDDYEKIFGYKAEDIGSGEYLYVYHYGNIAISLMGNPLYQVYVGIDDEENKGFLVDLESMSD